MKRTPLRRKKPLRLGSYPLQRLAGALIQQEFERRGRMKTIGPAGAPFEGWTTKAGINPRIKPLGRATPERKPMKRKALRRVGSRSKRSASALQAFREALHIRAKYACELCSAKGSPTWPLTLEPHHLVNRARAPGWPDLHNPEVNGMALCRSCHDAATLEPRICGERYLAAWAAHRDWILPPQRFKP